MSKDITLGKNYIDRDISWLSFNYRVLYQASRTKHISLIERLKFIGIASSNLDEFLMVRMSDAYHNNGELYLTLWDKMIEFKVTQERIYNETMKELEVAGTKLLKYKKLNPKHKAEVKEIFQSIYPVIVPLVYQPNIEFPHIHTKELCIIAGFDNGDIGVIPIRKIPRVFQLSPRADGTAVYITAEEVIYPFLQSEIFVGSDIVFRSTFRVLREASMTLNNDKNVYIVDRMRQVLKQRENSIPIMLEIGTKTMPNDILDLLCGLLDVRKKHVYKCKNILDLAFLIGKPFDIGGSYEEYIPFYPKELQGRKDIFEVISERDIILHHPFDSFEPVIEFISHAADDKDVVSIRQTLYRVSSDSSPIIEALCRAATKGKDVSVLLEIKARFDEEQNISLVDKLKGSGCKVIYGIEELKTHAKFALVVKKKRNGKYKCYAHVGTGNYNDKTSAIYTDISLFTEDKKICRDLITVFNVLSGKSSPDNKVESIKFAPYNIRSSIYKLIDREISHVSKGKTGMIIIKVNSLSDPDMVSKLYEASNKGVKVNIIARGICSIKPINSNIRVQSIVGRFLEHSRVYYFFNNNEHEMYISSADLLTRNLDRRVEIMVPVKGVKCRNKISRILITYLEDTFNSFIMNASGKHEIPNDGGINSHFKLIEESVKNSRVRRREFKGIK